MGATFELDGQGFMVLNGDPEFTFTPAVYVNWPKLLVMILIGPH
jgi:predicted 3-demethylubiquinone-9 3-methyltransferase (glyoxalase superfamily)